jgi:hypothetical protein
MSVIFPNLTIHSTCKDCGQAMTVINTDDTCHPLCKPKTTELQQLASDWLDAILASDETTAAEIEVLIDKLETVIDLARAAKFYAKWGWPVFPLGRHGKKPAIPKAKGGNGFKDATTDVERISKWWKRHPDHNIGVATGHAFDVIDVDPRHNGVASFLKLLADNNLPECHGIAVTASGGMHLYVEPTGKGNYANLREGIDYRGLGGYVAAPPSTLGLRWRSYTWLTQPSPKIKENHNDG